MRLLVRGDNRSYDHRLRLRVATELIGSSTIADAAFLPVARAALSVTPSDEAMARVVATAPLHRWVARFGDGPGAQSIGTYAARFALQLVGADSPVVRDEIEHFAEDILLPITGETLRSNLLEPHRSGGLELSGAGLAFSAAAPARREGWIVLRCVN